MVPCRGTRQLSMNHLFQPQVACQTKRDLLHFNLKKGDKFIFYSLICPKMAFRRVSVGLEK